MQKEIMSAKLSSLITVMSIVLAVGLVWGGRRAGAGVAVENTADVGLITVNAGQTARLIVTTPVASSSWGNDRPETVAFGFDVFKPSGVIAAAVGPVQKHFLLERRLNEVSLRPGEAASFDFASENGLLHVRPLVMGDGSVKKFDFTIELINRDGSVATASFLPAVQRISAGQR